MISFDLEEISSIISKNKFKNIILYFSEKFFEITSDLCLKLKEKNKDANFLIMITCSSGVDTMKFRLNSSDDTPDCVIYFGASCLCECRYSKDIPTYFVPLKKEFEHEEYIQSVIQKNVEEYSAKKLLILSDFTCSEYLDSCDISKNNCWIDVCKFRNFQQENLQFLEQTKTKIILEIIPECYESTYYPFLFPNNVSDYDLVIFLGECKNLELVLNCKRILVVDPLKKISKIYDGAKEFRKRISLIEKFKNQSKMFGIVFLNYTRSVSNIMDSSRRYCRKQKRIPFFLTLNQHDFELRLGNFTQLDSFVMVNVCECNFEIAQQTYKYFYPIIFWKEFLLVSREKIVYGGIQWNNDELDIIDDNNEDDDEKDEQNMQMIEREVFQKPKDAWYGLVVDAGNSEISDSIQQGLSGIASGYRTENDLF